MYPFHLVSSTPQSDIKELLNQLKFTNVSDFIEKYKLFHKDNDSNHIDKITNQYNSIISTFNSFYDKDDNVEIDIVVINSNTIAILTKFAIVNITNSKNEHHTIRDLVVTYNFYINNSYDVILSQISLYRLQLTKAEFCSGYVHSHATLNNVCFGQTDLYDLRLLLRNEYDIKNLELFLNSMYSFISWESLEGVPYSYIGQINSINYKSYIYDKSLVDQTILNLIPGIDWSKIEIVNNKSYLSVEFNSYLEDLLFDKLFNVVVKNFDNISDLQLRTICTFFTLSYGMFMNKVTYSSAPRQCNRVNYVYWKNQYKPMTITESKKTITLDNLKTEYHVHPEVQRQICFLLTQKLYQIIYDYRKNK